MFRLHLTRRIIFGVTTLIFLLCQSAAIAAACQAVALPADTTAVQAPCHEPAPGDSTLVHKACQTGCASQFSAAKPPQLPALDAAILPVATLGIDPPQAVTRCIVAENSPPDRAQPPPLSRLYCRMLN